MPNDWTHRSSSDNFRVKELRHGWTSAKELLRKLWKISLTTAHVILLHRQCNIVPEWTFQSNLAPKSTAWRQSYSCRKSIAQVTKISIKIKLNLFIRNVKLYQSYNSSCLKLYKKYFWMSNNNCKAVVAGKSISVRSFLIELTFLLVSKIML